MDDVENIRGKYLRVRASLDARARRLWAAKQARAFGPGGINAVRRATGLAYETVARGLVDLQLANPPPRGRVRRAGGGRKRSLPLHWQRDIEALISSASRLDSDAPLRWTSKSMRQVASELRSTGWDRSDTAVRRLLHELGYSLRSRRRSPEGAARPDPDVQFAYLSGRVQSQRAAAEPAIAIDSKRREWARVGRGAGREWHVERDRVPEPVRDFLAAEGRQDGPGYGGTLAGRVCWTNAGLAYDTSAFAASAIGRWWEVMGRAAYPGARTLVGTVDDDGGDGPLVRQWQRQLQAIASETGLAVSVCHLPPGTSRWSRLEPRFFRFTAGKIEDRPVLASAAIVSEISPPVAAVEPAVGCEVEGGRDGDGGARGGVLEEGIVVPSEFEGDWNYTVLPR